MSRRILVAFLSIAFIAYLAACTKEYSFESGKDISPATGTLKDTLGNCLPITVHGTYYDGVLPGPDTAYVQITVNVTTVGTYIIKTDLQNGFMFSDSGYFDKTGIDTVLLKPAGTPILPKPTDFTVTFDSSVCTFSVNVIQLVPATGSLKDDFGECLPSIVHGSFYEGITPGPDTAYVELQVKVSTPGSYSITTDLQNGFKFADAGVFINTGINTILLKPVGTPTLQQLTNFTVSFDTSACTFSVNVQDSAGVGGTDTIALNTWEFSTDNGYFHGTIDTTYALDTLGYHYQFMAGFTEGTDSVFYIFVSSPGTAIVTGTYNIQVAPPGFNGFQLNDALDSAIYVNITDPTSSNTGTIVVDSYDTGTSVVTGTFSGLANDSNGNAVINVTGGKFSAKLSP